MEYETRLPAAHLGRESVAELEALLRRDSTNPDVEIRLDHGAVTYHYDSVEELHRDVGLPEVVRSFEVVLAASEGEIQLAAEDGSAEFSLRLRGEKKWVDSRRRQLEGFFEDQGATLRTFLERYLGIVMGLVAVVAGLAIYYGGLAGFVGMRTPIDSLLFGSLALFCGGILHMMLNRVYPYAAVVIREPQRRLVYLAT